jgi:hypothetical protein
VVDKKKQRFKIGARLQTWGGFRQKRLFFSIFSTQTSPRFLYIFKARMAQVSAAYNTVENDEPQPRESLIEYLAPEPVEEAGKRKVQSS